MAEAVRMPLLSDTMKEGVIAEWHKKVGDTVKLKIMRNNQLEDVDVVLGPRVSEDQTSLIQQYEQQPNQQDDRVTQCYKFLPKALCDFMG